MLKQLLQRAATRLLRIFQLAAELGGGTPDDDHFVLRSGKRPLGISRRHVFAGNIGTLVTGGAAHSVNAQAILAALHILQMDMAIVALQRRVTGGMAVLAARRGKYFVDLQKCFARGAGIRLGRSGSGKRRECRESGEH